MPTIAPIDKPGSDETTTNIGGDCSVVAVGDGLSVVVVLVFGHSVVVVVVFGKVIGIVRCGAFVVVDVVGFVVGSCGVRLLLLDVDVDDEGCVVGGFGVGFGVGFGAGFGRVWNFERVSNVCDDEGAAGAGFGLVLIVLNVSPSSSWAASSSSTWTWSSSWTWTWSSWSASSSSSWAASWFVCL
eukprot:CAMPEP_0168584234 /NCGR_PEP_ID=MMETSP0420-20121227/3024_1 /TAXON_ID=498008 /ORGANISM="Pessonella sp." /LENGTH=183 /DNA_ID=CAMNT_0008619009 /DNA_START=308 /DNA_END=860 /DNA_ORIENTATION=+